MLRVQMLVFLVFSFVACNSKSDDKKVSSSAPLKSEVMNANDAKKVSQPKTPATKITLERFACKGHCPVYTVTVDEFGEVNWVGKDFVKACGKQSTYVTTDVVTNLVKLFNERKFFSDAIKLTYVNDESTDKSSGTLSFTYGEQTKKVMFDLGDSNLPAAVIELAQAIDKELNTAAWIGGESSTNRCKK